MAAHPRARGATSVEEQRGAVIAALDKLYEHEVPKRRSRTRLRLVTPRLAALKADQTGEGLRLFLQSRGRDLWAIGGHLELLAAVRVVMAARPGRKTWNTMQLTALWSDIGVDESASA
ncbi:MAG TPA: hypothetical protein VFE60_27035 [Roseiarcus sp.]|jgi:hypothetical protein|nr:hypothetical protein [Roseiarcus sp.]